MKKSELIESSIRVCRERHLSIHTERSYIGWINRFFDYSLKHGGVAVSDRVKWFLSDLAPNVTVSTQSQALNALAFLYRDVLKKDMGDIGAFDKAKRPKRLPEWLNDGEMRAVLEKLSGEWRLMAMLAYGSGLRLNELVSLRVKDLDFDQSTVIVRQGKGMKDRATFLPMACADGLRDQLHESRLVWERDRRNGLPGVFMPDALDVKAPRAGEEWPWHWVWPSRETSVDPRSLIRRRHHVHDNGFQKAVKAAGVAAGLSKRVHPHLFRHSFATAFLMQGGAIHELKELLGHANIDTTALYLHCIGPAIGRMRSPLDVDPSKVVAFPDTRHVAQITQPPRMDSLA